MIKKCQNPERGKEFVQKTKTQLYCCARCRGRMQDLKRKRAKETQCLYCGKTFTPSTAANLYCTPDCKRLAFNKRKRDAREKKAVIHEVECKTCGKIFFTKNKKKETCSYECREQLRTNRKEWIRYTGKAEKPRESQIEEINKKALSEGMSYGQYKAIHSGLIPTAEEIIESFNKRMVVV